MKKYTILFVLVVLFTTILSGCKTPNWQGNLDCNLTRSAIIENIMAVLQEESYAISSASDFIVTATSEEWIKLFVGRQRIEWFFRIEENKILGTATLCTKNNGETRETLSDDAGSNLTEYWRVRRKLEKICNNTMIIIDTRAKTNSAEQEENEFSK
jgi:hypothetical protein